MQVYMLNIADRRVTAEGDSTLVRTSSGVDVLRLLFYDEEWLGFSLECVLSSGGTVAVIGDAFTLSSGDDTAHVASKELPIPDWVLVEEGLVGVCVHGSNGTGDHIITEASWPLEVRREGIASSP